MVKTSVIPASALGTKERERLHRLLERLYAEEREIIQHYRSKP